MGQYSVDFSCGHRDTVALLGRLDDRWRKLDWLAEVGACPTCYRDARARRHADQSRTAVEANAQAGLPALEGTPKQIAWAECIRYEALASDYNRADLVDFLLAGRDVPGTQEQMQDLVRRVRAARTRLDTEMSAAWWIDRRDEVRWYVGSAYGDAVREIYADQIAEHRRRTREDEARRRAESEARREADHEKRLREQRRALQCIARGAREARTFRVASVHLGPDPETFWAVGTDGRIATGWYLRDDGWIVSELDGHPIANTPEAARIEAEARVVFLRQSRPDEEE